MTIRVDYLNLAITKIDHKNIFICIKQFYVTEITKIFPKLLEYDKYDQFVVIEK